MKQTHLLVSGLATILFIELCLLMLKTPSDDTIHLGIRLTGLLGFTALLFSVITSTFFEELDHNGHKKIKLHHLFSILGIVLITVHPILLAIDKGSLNIFIPKFNSWMNFWKLAGRPSLILLYIGLISGFFLIKSYFKTWKTIHIIVYLALFMGLIHGYLIGTDFQNPYIILIFSILFILSLYTFIYNQAQNRQYSK